MQVLSEHVLFLSCVIQRKCEHTVVYGLSAYPSVFVCAAILLSSLLFFFRPSSPLFVHTFNRYQLLVCVMCNRWQLSCLSQLLFVVCPEVAVLSRNEKRAEEYLRECLYVCVLLWACACKGLMQMRVRVSVRVPMHRTQAQTFTFT